MKNSKVRAMAIAAIMAVLAFVLQLFSFNVPIISLFANFDFGALPEIIGGFILGPVWAVVIIAVKLVLILATKGTSSMFTGEVQNFILSCAYVLPAIWYYRKDRSKKGAIIGLALGSLVSIIIAIFTNLYLIYPAYIKLFGMSWEQIIGMIHEVNPYINNIPTFVVLSVIPFNFISRVVTSLITVAVYKRISVPIKRFIQG